MKKKNRYKLSVYMLLSTISIIMVLVSVNYLHDYQDIKSLLLNLSTEIAGAVLLFLIVNGLFSLDNEENSKIDNLIKQVDNKFNPLKQSSEIKNNHILQNIDAKKIKRVNVLSYSLSLSIRKHRKEIFQAVENGAVIRIIIVNPKGDAINLVKLNSDLKSNLFKTDLSSSFSYMKDILENKNNKGSIEIRVIQWIPSCSIFMIENQKEIDDQARIGINDPSIKSKDSRRLGLHLIRSIHSNEFNYFLEQFNFLWNDSEALDLQEIE